MPDNISRPDYSAYSAYTPPAYTPPAYTPAAFTPPAPYAAPAVVSLGRGQVEVPHKCPHRHTWVETSTGRIEVCSAYPREQPLSSPGSHGRTVVRCALVIVAAFFAWRAEVRHAEQLRSAHETPSSPQAAHVTARQP